MRGDERCEPCEQRRVGPARLAEKCAALRRRLREHVGEQSLFPGGNLAHGRGSWE